MKPKSITKKPTTRKRPKSVLQKAWQTRRAKLLSATTGGLISLKEAASSLKATPISETETHRSEPKSKLDMQTDQLLIAAKSNNRDEARPRVRRELGHLIESARYDGFEDGDKRRKQMTDEAALCGIVAMFRLWKGVRTASHAPFVLSSIAAQALVEKLESLGYTSDGKRSDEAKQWQVATR